MKLRHVALTAIAGTAMLASVNASADNYAVIITNVTQNQIFTPIAVVSHRPSERLFSLGDAAPTGIAEVAEGGDTGPLEQALRARGKIKDIASVGALLMPGEKATVHISADWRHRQISLIGMLLPTNDGFVAINSVRIPAYQSKTVLARAYDAGTEVNDQLCDHIPGGGDCAGEGFNSADGEGYVHIHPGIHDDGDLRGADYDWNNPVAVIKIKRLGY